MCLCVLWELFWFCVWNSHTYKHRLYANSLSRFLDTSVQVMGPLKVLQNAIQQWVDMSQLRKASGSGILRWQSSNGRRCWEITISLWSAMLDQLGLAVYGKNWKSLTDPDIGKDKLYTLVTLTVSQLCLVITARCLSIIVSIILIYEEFFHILICGSQAKLPAKIGIRVYLIATLSHT